MSRILVLDQTNRPYRFTKSNRRGQTETLFVYDLHDLSDVFLRMACLVSARPSDIWFSLA
jgi:hypothetical protein